VWAVDLRMIGPSGIGTYLEALVPRVIERLQDRRWHLLGDPRVLAAYPFASASSLHIAACSTSIYHPLEQLELLRAIPRGTSLYWAPHLNAPLAFRGKLLVTVHDVFYRRADARRDTRIDKRLYLALLTRAAPRRADHVFCVSDFTRRELGLLRAPSSVIHNGVEEHWFAPASGERPCVERYLLFVGNLRPHKNVPRLVEAFARIAGALPHRLVIVGRRFGAYPALDAALAQAPTNRVELVGAVDREALRAWVAHADALVLPSLYEGFGLPPLEAMACGVPVLVSRAASLPEICGDAALYCDPHDVGDIARQLQRLLRDAELRARLIRAGPERARQFSWDAAADAYAKVLARHAP
jgi:glycosyltransferase involved in cell wall biosynthesis